MRSLAIDIGNTNHKMAVFDGREMVTFTTVKELNPGAVADLVVTHNVKTSIISSVALDNDEVVTVLKDLTHFKEFSAKVNPGINSKYITQNTLGLDRWAKVIAAYCCYDQEDCYIIDAGTCITYDFLSSEGEYTGGSISPGIGMRFDALNHYTKRLPLVDWNPINQEIPEGLDTNSAIKKGVLQGAVNEVIGNISQINEGKVGMRVLLTGGDATFLLEQLKNSIFAPQIIHDPYLVLRGLNEVIAFEHVQKD